MHLLICLAGLFFFKKTFNFVSPYGSVVKDPPAKQETQVWSLGQ